MKKEEITIKNTKSEILEALNAVLAREKNLSSTKSNPIEEEKIRKNTKAIEVSRENVKKNIFSEELNNKFRDLELAISVEEEKLKELYGIEKELTNLTLVINAGKDCIATIESNKKAETEKYNTSIKLLEDEYNSKAIALKKEYEANAKALKIERDRELEEYNYKIKRDRELANNKWIDEKLQRETKLANMEAETKQLLNEAKISVEHTKELEKKVNDIPILLEKEYERGKKDTTILLEKEHKYSTELLSKDFKNTIDRQTDKINSLEEELKRAYGTIDALQEKLDKAYAEVKELATKTVEATGGLKIIGNNSTEKI
ncbi:MAG: hypothetical protein Q4G04_04925 [bacterium]|nr:hypothetical protein [bacterium]